MCKLLRYWILFTEISNITNQNKNMQPGRKIVILHSRCITLVKFNIIKKSMQHIPKKIIFNR